MHRLYSSLASLSPTMADYFETEGCSYGNSYEGLSSRMSDRNQADTYFSNSLVSNDELAKFLIRKLIKTNGKESLKNIINRNYQPLEIASIQTTLQLRDFLQSYSHCFILRQLESESGLETEFLSNEYGDSNHCNKASLEDPLLCDHLEVEVTTGLKICGLHSRNSGSCDGGRGCGGMHICKFFVLSGKCTFGKGCKFGHWHSAWSDHNNRVLQRHLVDHLDVKELRVLFCRRNARTPLTRPMLCRFYNSATGCNKGNICNALHLCEPFLFDECKFGDSCRCSHDLIEPVVLHILSQYGIDVEDLAELMWDNRLNPTPARPSQHKTRPYNKQAKNARGKWFVNSTRTDKHFSANSRTDESFSHFTRTDECFSPPEPSEFSHDDLGQSDRSQFKNCSSTVGGQVSNGWGDNPASSNITVSKVNTILANLYSRVQELHSRACLSPQATAGPSPFKQTPILLEQITSVWEQEVKAKEMNPAVRQDEDTKSESQEDGEISESDGEISDSDDMAGKKREWLQDRCAGRSLQSSDDDQARFKDQVTIMVDKLRSESSNNVRLQHLGQATVAQSVDYKHGPTTPGENSAGYKHGLKTHGESLNPLKHDDYKPVASFEAKKATLTYADDSVHLRNDMDNLYTNGDGHRRGVDDESCSHQNFRKSPEQTSSRGDHSRGQRHREEGYGHRGKHGKTPDRSSNKHMNGRGDRVVAKDSDNKRKHNAHVHNRSHHNDDCFRSSDRQSGYSCDGRDYHACQAQSQDFNLLQTRGNHLLGKSASRHLFEDFSLDKYLRPGHDDKMDDISSDEIDNRIEDHKLEDISPDDFEGSDKGHVKNRLKGNAARPLQPSSQNINKYRSLPFQSKKKNSTGEKACRASGDHRSHGGSVHRGGGSPGHRSRQACFNRKKEFYEDDHSIGYSHRRGHRLDNASRQELSHDRHRSFHNEHQSSDFPWSHSSPSVSKRQPILDRVSAGDEGRNVHTGKGSRDGHFDRRKDRPHEDGISQQRSKSLECSSQTWNSGGKHGSSDEVSPHDRQKESSPDHTRNGQPVDHSSREGRHFQKDHSASSYKDHSVSSCGNRSENIQQTREENSAVQSHSSRGHSRRDHHFVNFVEGKKSGRRNSLTGSGHGAGFRTRSGDRRKHTDVRTHSPGSSKHFTSSEEWKKVYKGEKFASYEERKNFQENSGLRQQARLYERIESREDWDTADTVGEEERVCGQSAHAEDAKTAEKSHFENDGVDHENVEAFGDYNISVADSQALLDGDNVSGKKMPGSIYKRRNYKQWKRSQEMHTDHTDIRDDLNDASIKNEGTSGRTLCSVENAHHQTSWEERLIQEEQDFYRQGKSVDEVCLCGAGTVKQCFKCRRKCDNYQEWKRCYAGSMSEKGDKSGSIQQTALSQHGDEDSQHRNVSQNRGSNGERNHGHESQSDRHHANLVRAATSNKNISHRKEKSVSRHCEIPQLRKDADIQARSRLKSKGNVDCELAANSGLRDIDTLHDSVNQLLNQFVHSRSNSPVNYRDSSRRSCDQHSRKRKYSQGLQNLDRNPKATKVLPYNGTGHRYHSTSRGFSGRQDVSADSMEVFMHDNQLQEGLSVNQSRLFSNNTTHGGCQPGILKTSKESHTSDTVEVFYDTEDPYQDEFADNFGNDEECDVGLPRLETSMEFSESQGQDNLEDVYDEMDQTETIPESKPKQKISRIDLRHRLQHKKTDENDLRNRLRKRQTDLIKKSTEPLRIRLNSGATQPRKVEEIRE